MAGSASADDPRLEGAHQLSGHFRSIAPAPPRTDLPTDDDEWGAARTTHSQFELTKRRKGRAACLSCRALKVKCDAARPVCASCSSRSRECVYETIKPEETRVGALKRKFEETENKSTTYLRILDYIRTRPELEALEIYRRLRVTSDYQALANFIEDGDLLIQPLSSYSGIDQVEASPARMREEARIGRGLGRPLLVVPAKPWTTVTDDSELVSHLITLYFTWEEPFWQFLDMTTFLSEMRNPRSSDSTPASMQFCTPALVNAVLAHASCIAARIELLDSGSPSVPEADSLFLTYGEKFAVEARRLIEQDRYRPSLTNIEALLALYSRGEFLSGAWNGQRYIERARVLYDRLDLGREVPLPNDYLHNDAVKRKWNAVAYAIWGFYNTDIKGAFAQGRKPVFARPQLEKLAVASRDDDIWYPYPYPGGGRRMMRQEFRVAHNALLDILDQLVDFSLVSDRVQPKRDLYRSRIEALARSLSHWEIDLPEWLRDGSVNALPHEVQMHIYKHGAWMTLMRYAINNPEMSFNYDGHSPALIILKSSTMIMDAIWHYQKVYDLCVAPVGLCYGAALCVSNLFGLLGHGAAFKDVFAQACKAVELFSDFKFGAWAMWTRAARLVVSDNNHKLDPRARVHIGKLSEEARQHLRLENDVRMAGLTPRHNDKLPGESHDKESDLSVDVYLGSIAEMTDDIRELSLKYPADPGAISDVDKDTALKIARREPSVLSSADSAASSPHPAPNRS